MANTVIQLKNSGATGNVPVALAPGELAINYADGKLYYGNASNNVVLFDVITEPAGLDTELQFNDSGVFGSSANLKFNKTTKTLTTDKIVSANIEVSSNLVAENVIAHTALYVGIADISHTPLANSLGYFTGNSSPYIQVNVENIDPLGSADYVATADVGSDETFYIDLGIQNSGQNDGNIKRLDGFLLVQGNTGQTGGNLIIGTISGTPGQETRFVSGGNEDANVVFKIGEYGLNVVKGDITSNATTRIFNVANNSFAQANLAYGVANSAFSQANLAYGVANSAFAQANLAFNKANSSLSSSGGTISGDLIITGNANVAGAFITNTYIQFADGSKQYVANAGSGGGGFGLIDLGLITESVFNSNIIDLQQ
jgi:hypothetical protein